MGQSQDAKMSALIARDPEFKALVEEHRMLDEKLKELDRKVYLLPTRKWNGSGSRSSNWPRRKDRADPQPERIVLRFANTAAIGDRCIRPATLPEVPTCLALPHRTSPVRLGSDALPDPAHRPLHATPCSGTATRGGAGRGSGKRRRERNADDRRGDLRPGAGRPGGGQSFSATRRRRPEHLRRTVQEHQGPAPALPHEQGRCTWRTGTPGHPGKPGCAWSHPVREPPTPDRPRHGLHGLDPRRRLHRAVPTLLIGNDAFQEADIVGISRPCTKHNYLVKETKDLARIVRSVLHRLQGRPGPVLVDMPRTSDHPAEYDLPKEVSLRGYHPNYEGHPRQVERRVRMLLTAERPVVYAGAG